MAIQRDRKCDKFWPIWHCLRWLTSVSNIWMEANDVDWPSVNLVSVIQLEHVNQRNHFTFARRSTTGARSHNVALGWANSWLGSTQRLSIDIDFIEYGQENWLWDFVIIGETTIGRVPIFGSGTILVLGRRCLFGRHPCYAGVFSWHRFSMSTTGESIDVLFVPFNGRSKVGFLLSPPILQDSQRLIWSY